MEEIKDLQLQLKNGFDEFNDSIIHISGNGLFLDENSMTFITNLSFHNCIFTGTHLEFENIDRPEFRLGFFDCEFQISLDIKNCNFIRLGFRDVKSKKSIHISGGNYKNLFFRNNNLEAKGKNLLTGKISIENLNITEKVELDYINHSNGVFDFSNNNLSNSDGEENDKVITFENSTFENINFRKNQFFKDASFKEMEIKGKCYFEECDFDKVNFSNLTIGGLRFVDCKFFKTAVFHYILGNISSYISFESCLFEKYIQFNGTNSSTFGVIDVEFSKIVSFQETEFDTVLIDRTIFEKGALFDDINIKNIEKCDRRTIRIIKRELVNSHNQIDYLRFKAYELNAYKKEGGKNWKDNLVLFFNEQSNYFGLDWLRGVMFTIVTSFILYLLYLISFVISIKSLELLPPDLETFFVKYLKFVNPLSFLKPPILQAENYFFPLFILIIGKIFVSFGIYQTIQAFRKFGVNGG